METRDDTLEKARKGDATAMFRMATIHDKDYAEDVLSWLQKAALLDHTKAMRALGERLERGNGTEPDLHQAQLLYAQCAAKDCAWSQTWIRIHRDAEALTHLVEQYKTIPPCLEKEKEKRERESRTRITEVLKPRRNSLQTRRQWLEKIQKSLDKKEKAIGKDEESMKEHDRGEREAALKSLAQTMKDEIAAAWISSREEKDPDHEA